MLSIFKRFRKAVQQYATSAVIAGSIAVLTGFTPSEWVELMLRAIRIPEQIRHAFDFRIAFVLIGVSIIVGDILFRQHKLGHNHPLKDRTKSSGIDSVAQARIEGPAPTEGSVTAGDASIGPTGNASKLAQVSVGAKTDILPSFGDRPAIAVLPFTNMSGDPEQEYFADGISEDLIASISSWCRFPVIARNSSFTYKGRSVDIKNAAQELGARYLVEGSVRRSGNRVRVTAQLIDATSGHHVWADRYDRDIDDIFAI